MGYGIYLKKALSQHFMKEVSYAERIVQSMGIQQGDLVLEIGPGDGVLTRCLLSKPLERLFAVELDRRLYPLLTGQFGKDGRFQLIEKDFLKLDMSSIAMDARKLRVVGNLPYAVTSPILFKILENRSIIVDLTATVQKEVAERLTAPPGNKTYGIPSVFFQMHATIRLLFSIPRKAFFPVPDVDSAVVHVLFLPKAAFLVKDEAFFKTMVKTVFNQRRKMLRNTVKPFIKNESDIENAPVKLDRRPETLSVREFAELSDFFQP
jgi:16S rRNA (adenine1518-N6/adenine1519-N6)-dimethyltransferase